MSGDPIRGCGSCTLCCTVMKVTFDPPDPVKPARTPCQHECRGKGCAIYDDRPSACREFECLWLHSQSQPDDAMRRAFRPDVSGVVLEVNSASYIVAHSKRPGSWKLQPMRSWLRTMASRTRVLIEDGDTVQVLYADGSTDPLEFVGIDPSTNERLYARSAELAKAKLAREAGAA